MSAGFRIRQKADYIQVVCLFFHQMVRIEMCIRDRAQSMNLYITNDYSMRQVLRLYLEAWRAGVKTIYYVRSKALEVEACESCSS